MGGNEGLVPRGIAFGNGFACPNLPTELAKFARFNTQSDPECTRGFQFPVPGDLSGACRATSAAVSTVLADKT